MFLEMNEAPEPSSPKPRLVLSYVGSCTMELEQPSPDSGGSGCRVKLSSYGSRERVELHVELENRSRRALSLALGSFTAGSSSSCILSASLQSCLDGTWKSACVLQPRGYAKQRAAMFLPAFQAVKMRILGKVVSLGRFGGLALRVGGDAPNAAEVLLPLTSTEVEGLEEPNQLKPLLRFTVGKPVKTLQVDPKPVWIGPHEARQPRRYSTFETEVVSEVCELAMCDDSDAKLAPRMQTRRLQAFQRSLSPQLPVPRHHEDIQEDKPSSVPDPMRSTFSGLRSARMKLRSRPNTVPAIVDSEVQAEPPSELADPSGLGNKPPRSQRGVTKVSIAQLDGDSSWHRLAELGPQPRRPGRSGAIGIGRGRLGRPECVHRLDWEVLLEPIGATFRRCLAVPGLQSHFGQCLTGVLGVCA